MSGEKRRALKAIFASFERRREAREYEEDRRQQEEEIKKCMEEIEKTVQDIEDFLGTAGNPIEGNSRKDLMLFLYGLLEQLQEYADEADMLTGENEALRLELAALKKRNELQAEIIQLYSQVQTAQSKEQQELLDRINQLTQQIEELSKKSRQRRESAKEAKSKKERKEELEERIQRCQAQYEKLMRKMDALESEDPNEQEHKDSPESNDGKEGEAAEKTVKESASSPDSSDEAAPQENTPPPSTDDTDTPELQDKTRPSLAPLGNQEESGSKDRDKDMTLEQALERIQALEQQLNDTAYEKEEMNYNANKGNKDSNTPSGKIPPWKSCKSKTPGFTAEDLGNPAIDGEKTLDSLIEQEEEAESASLHDPHKSPNAQKNGKRGKPAGTNGGGRTMPEWDEKRINFCTPEKCASCPNCKVCKELEEARQQSGSAEQGNSPSLVRNVYDLEIVRVLTEHRIISCVCPDTGQTLSGTFPDGVNNWFQYGLGIKGLAITLNTVGMVSYERIADILRGMMNDAKFSAQTACNWVHDFADKLNPAASYMKAGVFAGDYLNSDETGVKVKGVLHWVHVACNMTLTYMRVDKQRGDGAMNRIGILSAYMGTIITDCWASYWDKGSRHGLCNAHILRELYALVKFFERDKGWAQKMMDLLNEMNDERKKLIDANVANFTEEQIQEYRRRYERIVAEGMEIHPDSEAYKSSRGKARKFRGRNLLDRLKEREDNVLLFLEDFQVPFTNNAAERSLRLLGVKRSVVGSFDTYEGADDFALIWSYISSARKRNHSAYHAIKAALEGHAVEFLFDEEEIKELDEVIENLDKINKSQFLADREADKQAVMKAQEEATQKQLRADEARKEAERAEEKARDTKAEAARVGTDKAKKKADRAAAIAEKARNTADKKSYAAEKARAKAVAILEDARYQAKAALYFLDLEDFEWDFDKEIGA